MNQTVAKLLQPVADVLPHWLPLDGTIQGFVLFWYLSNYTPLSTQQILPVLAVNGGVHGVLHHSACMLQGGEQ